MKTKYIVLIVVVVALMLGGMYYAGLQATRLGKAMMQNLTEDDAPIDYSALAFEPGPDDPAVNGFSRLRELDINLDLGRVDTVNRRNNDYAQSDPFFPNEEPLTAEELESIANQNAEALTAIREALALDVFRFDEQLDYDSAYPHALILQEYFTARVLEARLTALQGDPDAALAMLVETAAELRRTMSVGGGIMNHMFVANSASACNDEIAYLLGHYPTSADALHRALADYLLRGAMQASADSVLKSEFQLTRNSMDDMIAEASEEIEGFSEETSKAIVEGAFFKRNRTTNEYYTYILGMLEQQDRPLNQREYQAYELLIEDKPEVLKAMVNGNMMGDVMLRLMLPSMSRVDNVIARTDFESDCVYLMLALRLYQLEHGALPPTLDALVPDIIPAVPTDPYDGQPIRYDAERALLYSVGEDFIDNGGSKYISRFDHEAPDFDILTENNEIAENDLSEPTFHIRFDAQ